MEFDKRRPIYEQVMEYFIDAFIRGDYKLGESLPSRRELAQTLNVNPNTIQRAFKEMEDQTLIVTEPNVPSRVTTNPRVIENLKNQVIHTAVDDFYQKMTSLDLDHDAIIDYINLIAQERKEPHHD